MTRRILLSVRPDTRAAATLETGAWLARELGAEVVLLYVATELDTVAQIAASTGVSEESAEQQIRAEAQRDLEEVVRRHLDGVSVSLRIERGGVVERITEVAGEVGASLVVIGTHGRTGAARLVLGDTSDAVLRAAHCPVVVVPRGREVEG